MKEKVVEILIYLMTAIHDNKRLNEIDLDDLRKRGYTQTEISAAFSWLHENMPSTRSKPESSGHAGGSSRRVFHEAERMVLTNEGQGYLIQLSELGILTQHDLETVIERAMLSGYEQLSVIEIKELVASVLFARDPGGEYGGRTMLNSGDTIH
jgi:uncharacterized protein Smg (DUF494 family)